MSERTVIDLSQATDVRLVGGKAASLKKLIDAGFNVPAGFVISTRSRMKMSPGLEQEVMEAFNELCSELVAVRSSAVAEDGTKDAWAGQLETFLNVPKDELINKVEAVWASANSDRARSYSANKNIKAGNVAVIVQAMVQSQAAGVGFSINPVNHDDEEIVIEAGLGLGEAVVSGEITPDTYMVRKTSLEIIQKHISIQTKQLTKGGWQQLGEEGSKQKITDGQILELAKMIIKLEDYYGFAVDTEWVLVDGEFIPNQSRPITTLK